MLYCIWFVVNTHGYLQISILFRIVSWTCLEEFKLEVSKKWIETVDVNLERYVLNNVKTEREKYFRSQTIK